MPRTYTKRPAPKRRYKKRATRAGVSTKVKKYVRRIMPKTEVKSVWNHDNELKLNTLVQGQYLTGPTIVNGTAPSARIGNVINALSMSIKGCFYNNAASETYVRALLIGTTGTNDPVTNLFRATALGTVSGLATIYGLDAMYYPINKADYKVYWDQTYKLGGSQTGTAGSNTRMFNKFVKFNRRKIEYKSTATGDGNQSWYYKLIYIASDANDDTTGGTDVEMSALTRFYFTDA